MECMFVEIPEFTRRVIRLGLEEDLRLLQNRLKLDPRAGDLEPGTGGCARCAWRIHHADRGSVVD